MTDKLFDLRSARGVPESRGLVAIIASSGENATAVTDPLCPVNARRV